MSIISAITGAAGIAANIFGQNRQEKLQKQFAKTGIQWKVADAKKAGIHPIYAMGANTVSYQPQQTGDYGIGAMGQDISRAIDSTRTAPQRASAQGAVKLLPKLQLERAGLENDLLRAQVINTQNRNASNPAMAAAVDTNNIPGQANSGQKPVPKYVKIFDPRNPSKPAEWIINPDIASDFGEMLAPEVLPHLRKPIDRMSGALRKADRELRRRGTTIRRSPSKSWGDFFLPTLSYRRR